MRLSQWLCHIYILVLHNFIFATRSEKPVGRTRTVTTAAHFYGGDMLEEII